MVRGQVGCSLPHLSPQGLRLYRALGLAWVAYMTNTSSESWNEWGWFGGWTVQLGADINLNGYLWEPIGNSNTFDGTFDGCNHTISNLRQNVYEQTIDYVGTSWSVGGANGSGPFGLFGYFTGVAVRNLTMNHVDVFSEGGAIGAVAGYAFDNAVFENITVKNAHLNGYSRGVGCIVGSVVYFLKGNVSGAAFAIGGGLAAAGLGLMLFIGCNALAKGLARGMKKMILGCKGLLIGKKGA